MINLVGRRWTARRRTTAPIEVLWCLLARPEHWGRWGPSVRSATGPSPVHPGARGRIRTAVGPVLRYRITNVEPGRSWVWEVAGIAATGHRLDPDPGRDGITVVAFDAPWWAPVYLPVLHLGLWRLVRRAEAARTGSGDRSGV